MTTKNAAAERIVIIDMGIGGMTCDDCVDHVTGALGSVPGVASVKVSFEDRSAVVTARQDVSSDALSSAVRGKGYNAFERGRTND